MAEETPVLPGARLVAWLSFVFGTIVSVAFNVLAAFLPPPGAGGDWRPSVWAVVFSTVWPLGLLLSVELLARTAQRRTWFAYVIRYGGMTVVAAFSAVISYQHIRAVLLGWHYPELSATVGPFVIDGLMVLAGYAMIQGSLAWMAKRARGAEIKAPSAGDIADAFGVPRELIGDSKPDPVDVHRDELARAEWNGLPLKPLTVPLPQPREEAPVNGRKPVAAAAKPRGTRAAAGPTVEEIVAKVVDRMAAGEQITKRVITEDYGVGSGKANEALRRAREQHEIQTRKEEK